MLNAAPLIGFIPVRDLTAAREFYAETLGLTVIEESPAAVICDAGGTMLRITAVTELTPQPFSVAGWRVPDITLAVEDLGDRDIGCELFDGIDQDEDGIWNAPNGDRVVWFRDPDANLLSLTQFEASVVDEYWV